MDWLTGANSDFEKVFTITLADGTEIPNLHLNGNNWVSEEPVYLDQFIGKLGSVSITDGEETKYYENLKILPLIQHYEGSTALVPGYYFVLQPITKEEMLYANVDYLSMMTGIDLEEQPVTYSRLRASTSPRYETVLNYYKSGLWNINRIRLAVGKWITESEFEDITGTKYS